LNSGASIADWMDGNTPTDDPQGWVGLWQLGLAVELSARHAVTGRPIDQASLLAAVTDVLETLRKGPFHEAWARIRNHLALDLPIRAADALLAKPGERRLAEIALDRLQVSLRPFAGGDSSETLPEPLLARIKAVDWPWHKQKRKVDEEAEKTEALPDAEKAKADERYANWARRFVAASPVAERRTGTGPIFDEGNTTTIAPLAATVEALCADAGGDYRFTREIKQQWAMSRLVRVAVEERYDRLVAAMTGTSARTDDEWDFASVGGYTADRVRRLEPPQLISERLVQDVDGTPFQEVVFARHAEATLSSSNLPSFRQLQYVGTERRYRRRFYDVPWATKLDLRPKPVLPRPPIGEIDEAWNPAFAQDTEFLAASPSARFGALGFLTPAEAFLYDAQVDIRARAAACSSAIVEVPVHRTMAAKTEPETDPALTVVPGHGGTWSDDQQATYLRWKDALAAHEPLQTWLTMRDHRISVRFPRYFESLKKTEQARERVGGTVGMLPDGGASLQFSLKRVGAEETVAAIRTDRGGPSGIEPFALIQTGPDVVVYALAHQQSGDWSDGLKVAFRAGLDPTSVSASSTLDGLDGRPVAPREPCAALDWKPGYLPSTGPLARAAPLALRLATPNDKTAHLINPFPFPTAMVRPLTTAGAAIDLADIAAVSDLAIGLRLLLDPERLAAAVAYGTAWPGKAPLALAEAIETAPSVALRRTVPVIDGALWQQMLGALAIWRREDAVWSACAADAAPPGANDALIVAAKAKSVEWQTVLQMFLDHAGDDGDPERQRSTAELSALTVAAQRLAAAALEPPEAPVITAWVQRENEPRAIWGRMHA